MLSSLDQTGQTCLKFKTDFPFRMHGGPFAKANTFPEDPNFRGRCIIFPHRRFVGPKSTFYELTITSTDNGDDDEISYQLFKTQANDDSKEERMKSVTGMIYLFLVQNNKYLGVIQEKEYTVYDIENDKWLPLHTDLMKPVSYRGSRYALIGDDIIVYNGANKMFFYYIAGDHITLPIFLKEYTLDTDYSYHGLSCIKYDEKIDVNNDDGTINIKYEFKILIFGGSQAFLKSFIELGVELVIVEELQGDVRSSNINNNAKFSSKMTINQAKIDSKEIICDENVSILLESSTTGESFGHDIVHNIKNEAIIVIFGGSWGQQGSKMSETHRNVYLYNCVNKTLKSTKDVKLICSQTLCYVYIFVTVFTCVQ